MSSKRSLRGSDCACVNLSRLRPGRPHVRRYRGCRPARRSRRRSPRPSESRAPARACEAFGPSWGAVRSRCARSLRSVSTKPTKHRRRLHGEAAAAAQPFGTRNRPISLGRSRCLRWGSSRVFLSSFFSKLHPFAPRPGPLTGAVHEKTPGLPGASSIAGAGFEPATFGL
jgi:hypothetical protein